MRLGLRLISALLVLFAFSIHADTAKDPKILPPKVNDSPSKADGSPRKVDDSPQACGSKTVVGPTIFVTVEETGLMYLARTDTGANGVSLNAWNLVVEEPEKKRVDNIGKMLHFRTANEKGRTVLGRARIVDNVRVTGLDPNDIQEHYVIELGVTYQGRKKVVNASLDDRGHMGYPVLLGRIWLEGNYIVDVALPEYQP